MENPNSTSSAGEHSKGTKFEPKFNFDDFINDTNKHAPGNEEPVKEVPNPFPVDAFPLPIQEIITATNECLNYPPDFMGASILFAVSVATGNTFRLEVRNGWLESSVLFIANVGRPGTVKTHPLFFALQPLFNIQQYNHAIYERKKREYDRIMKMNKKERIEEGVDEDPIKPCAKKHTVSDFTPEALAEVHKCNKRGIGVYADELAGWFKNFNRYHKGAEAELWLSAWSCKQIDIDRKGSDPTLITLPFISVGGNIQPAILNDLAKDSRSQNGFIDRILFAFPQGLQKPYWSDKELQPAVIELWQKIISQVLRIPQGFNQAGSPEPNVIKFTPDAYIALSEWQRVNTDLCNNAENEMLASVYSKFEIYVSRLALIMEILSWACAGKEPLPEHVTVDSVHSAIKLVEYFRATAEKVQTIIASNNPMDKLPENKRKFYEALPDSFTTAEALKVAELLNIAPDTMHKWLKGFRGTFLKWLKNGNYEKLI